MIRIQRLFIKGISLSCILILFLGGINDLNAGRFKPDQIKAAFIYNLMNFIFWPTDILSDSSKPFVICVLKQKKIAENLSIITEGEKIKGHSFKIKELEDLSNIDACQVIFVGEGAEKAFNQLEIDGDKPILTIGESEEFLKRGGIVGLLKLGKRIQIIINLKAAEMAGISFNSKLLKVAKIFDRQ